MNLKKYKAGTAGQRFKMGLTFEEITKTKPERSVVRSLRKISARSHGQVTVKGRGGGHKRNLRAIDFKRNKREIPAKIAAIEYDPNRTANIALLHYQDGEKRYILAPENLQVGQKVVASLQAEIKPGNALPIGKIPIGTFIHNIELTAGRGGPLARSAGTAAIIAAREGQWVHVKLPSKEIRKVHTNCYATVGQLGNLNWKSITFGKAGRLRYLGRKPHVRGVAQDPGSPPHGGGEGKSGTGMNPKTPTGKPAFKKTRKKNKPSSKLIIARRKK